MSEELDKTIATNGDSPASPPANRRRGRQGSSTTPNRLVAWYRGWTRRHLGREQMSAFFKTLLWVGPLTALIWVYAERQQLARKPQVTRPVEVVINDPTKVVRIMKPADKNVVLELVGPQAALERFTEQGNPLSDNPPLRIALDGTVTDGWQKIRTIRVGQDKRFAEAGITVVSAIPEEIEILIDPLVEVDARVISDDPTIRATFTPPTVKVRGPRSIVRPDELERDKSELLVRAGLKERAGQLSATEATELSSVKLTTDLNDPNVTIVPASVTARVENERLVEYRIPAVRVVVSATPSVWNEYRVDLPDGLLINNVDVIGPEDQIRTLKPGLGPGEQQVLPKATVEIAEGLTGQAAEVTGKLKYDLPPNVRLKPTAQTEVRVTVTPR